MAIQETEVARCVGVTHASGEATEAVGVCHVCGQTKPVKNICKLHGNPTCHGCDHGNYNCGCKGGWDKWSAENDDW